MAFRKHVQQRADDRHGEMAIGRYARNQAGRLENWLLDDPPSVESELNPSIESNSMRLFERDSELEGSYAEDAQRDDSAVIIGSVVGIGTSRAMDDSEQSACQEMAAAGLDCTSQLSTFPSFTTGGLPTFITNGFTVIWTPPPSGTYTTDQLGALCMV